jgi:hypothetical protein
MNGREKEQEPKPYLLLIILCTFSADQSVLLSTWRALGMISWWTARTGPYYRREATERQRRSAMTGARGRFSPLMEILTPTLEGLMRLILWQIALMNCTSLIDGDEESVYSLQ